MEEKPKLTPELAEALEKVEATRKARRSELIAGGLIAPIDDKWKPQKAGAQRNANFLEPRQTPDK
jgi:hypothetical protein